MKNASVIHKHVYFFDACDLLAIELFELCLEFLVVSGACVFADDLFDYSAWCSLASARSLLVSGCCCPELFQFGGCLGVHDGKK